MAGLRTRFLHIGAKEASRGDMRGMHIGCENREKWQKEKDEVKS